MVFEAFYYGISVAGYPSVIVGLMVLGGVQLIMIGVVGEYIGKILSEIKARPIYFVAEHEREVGAGQADRRARRAGADGGGMSEPRPIWLCADDYGISPAVNGAIRDLVRRGRINATSVMVAAPSFHRSEAVSLNLLNAGVARVAIGLHVTLTAPFVPLSPGFAPLRDGAFLPLQDMLRRALLRRLSRKKLEIEIATQLGAFVTAFGRVPDFVDGHQHVHQFPQVRDALLGVVKEIAPNAWVRQCGRAALPLRRRLSDKKGAAARRAQPQRSASVRRRSASPPIRRSPAPTISRRRPCRISPTCFRAFLDELPAGGLIMCHPGKVDAELERLDPLTYQREREYAYFAGEAFPALLACTRRHIG